MTLGVLKNVKDAKVGLIASKRVGGAVERNRVRRRLREILRLTRSQWITGAWVVVIARRAAVDASYEDLHQEWLKLAKKSGILAKTKENARSDEPSAPASSILEPGALEEPQK